MKRASLSAVVAGVVASCLSFPAHALTLCEDHRVIGALPHAAFSVTSAVAGIGTSALTKRKAFGWAGLGAGVTAVVFGSLDLSRGVSPGRCELGPSAALISIGVVELALGVASTLLGLWRLSARNGFKFGAVIGFRPGGGQITLVMTY